MKNQNRLDQIKNVEKTVTENNYSRKNFILTIGQIVALSSIASLGLSCLVSCMTEEVSAKGFNCGNCQPGWPFGGYYCECPNKFAGYDCPIPFSCPQKNTCTPVNCPKGIDKYSCTVDVHEGGKGS